MLDSPPFLSASISHAFVFGAMRLGLDPADLFKQAGVDLAILDDVDAVVRYDKHMLMTRLILSHHPRNNACLHIGKHFVPKRYGLLGHLMQSAATLEQALVDFHRFQYLTNNICTRRLSRTPEGLRISVETHPTVRLHPDFLAIPSRHEAPLTVPLALARHLTGKRIIPLRVSFRHLPSGDRSEHDEYFGVPVQFGMPTDEIIFDPETLRTPLLEKDETKYRRALDLVLAHVDPIADLAPVGAMLRQRLLQSIHEDVPRISVVARSLGMSTRTLQRRLEAEGTNFDSVVDAVRRDLALQHLINPSISMYEIAGLVGFVEPSPFFRAFRRWFGCTPKEWRHKHRVT
ncbi:MAG TPA: AraC family transcriptional regulator [Polyangium sp.]|nr:AraC family transcriptional regulator [Polyangium sp.]